MSMRFIQILWASPNTLFALVIATLLAPFGARWTVHTGVIEISGGAIAAILRRLPIAGGAAALTLGHVVFGVNEDLLDRTREHERVHVAQYGVWGVFFLPAYAAATLIAALRGQRPYRDNYFERAAYAVSDGN